MTSVKSSDKNW